MKLAALAGLLLLLVGCAPPEVGTSSKASTGSGSSPSASTTLPGGSGSTISPAAKPYTRGAIYGSCVRQFDSNFKPMSNDVTASAPVIGCSMTEEPSCPSGFQVIQDTPVQMNCSATPSGSNVLPCYFISKRCVKLAGTDADENYQSGQVYGACLRALNSNFQVTSADSVAAYPITSCTTAAEPTCASGFKVVADNPVQMNCSSTPSSTFVPCYYKTQRCMRI